MRISEEEADWRYSKVFRVKGDQTVYGFSVKDGELGWLTSKTEDKNFGEISFPTPSPAALAFSVAFDSARAAIAVREQLRFSGRGRGEKSIEKSSVPLLYAYFEQAMIAAVFSFQCVEAYANQTIERLVTSSIEVQRRSGPQLLTPRELQRHLSTEEKLTIILPKVLAVPSPKGTTAWQLYRHLKDVRDSTVHLKSDDQYVRHKVDRESVYYRLLKRSPIYFPRAAARVIHYFSQSTPERWFEIAELRLAQIKTK